MTTIGLFGTCGKSSWRDRFIVRYQRLGIPFFNPQVDDWKPELAQIEAQHLAQDAIILFPVTAETYGTGSLAETGFSILQALKLNEHRDVVIMIEQHLNAELMTNAELAKESLRARKLVLEHVKQLKLDQVYLVETFGQMLQVSLTLYEIAQLRVSIERYNP